MKDSVQQALLTESPINDQIHQRLSTSHSGYVLPPLRHGAMGVCTEGGEMLDALKKHIFYGKPIDGVNLIEEVGDVLWYLAILCDELHIDLGEVMQRNIAKLRARYPERFSSHDAINRNLEQERKVLEGGDRDAYADHHHLDQPP